MERTTSSRGNYSTSAKENEPVLVAATSNNDSRDNGQSYTTPPSKPGGARASLAVVDEQGLTAYVEQDSALSLFASPAGRHKHSPADSFQSTPVSASRIPRPSGFVTKIPTPSAKEKKLAAELEAVRLEKERLSQENTSLQSALQEAQDAIEWLRSEEAQLRSRASVAEESRTATSKVLLNLTEQASRLHAERAQLHDRLVERDLDAEHALALTERMNINDSAVRQEANDEVYLLTEGLAAAEEALSAREAQLCAAQEATSLLAGREEELVHQLQLASFAVQQEVEEKTRTIVQLQEECKDLAYKLETARTDHKAELTRALTQLQDNEAQLLGRVSQLSKQLTAAQEQLVSKDDQMVKKDEQLAAAQVQLISKDDQLVKKDEQLAAAQVELNSKDEQLAAAQEQLVSKEELLANKDGELTSKEEQLKATATALDQAQGDARRAAKQAAEELQRVQSQHGRELAAVKQQLKVAMEAKSKAKALAKAVEDSNREVAGLRRVIDTAQARAEQLETLLEAAEESRTLQVATLRAELSAGVESTRQEAATAAAAAKAAASAELAAQLEGVEQRRQADANALTGKLEAAVEQANELRRQLEEGVAGRLVEVAAARAQAADSEQAAEALREMMQQLETRHAAELASLQEQLSAARSRGQEAERSSQNKLELTIAAKDAELAAVRAELAAVQRNVATAAATTSKQEVAAAEQRAELQKINAALAAAEKAQAQLREQLAQAAADSATGLAGARAELEREREAVVRLQSREALLLAEVAELRQAAHSSEQQVLHLQRELQAIQDEIGDMQNAAASLLQQDSAWLEETSRRVTCEEEGWRQREAQQAPSAPQASLGWAAGVAQHAPAQRAASASPAKRPSLAVTVEALTRQLEDAAGQVERLGRERNSAVQERDTLQQDGAALQAEKEALAVRLAYIEAELQGSAAREQQLQQRVTELETTAASAPAAVAAVTARPAPGKLRLPPLPPLSGAMVQPSPRLPCRVTAGAAAAGASPRLGITVGGSGVPASSPFMLATAHSRGHTSGVPKLLLGPAVGGGPKQGGRPGAPAAGLGKRRLQGPGVKQGGRTPTTAPLMVVAGKWVAGLGVAALGLAAAVHAVHLQRQRASSALRQQGSQEKLPPLVPQPKWVPSKMARLPGRGRKGGG